MGINQNDQSDYIKGATDDTLIGNVGDRLKCDVHDSILNDENVIVKVDKIKNGSSSDMTVNGSVTPVNFDWSPGVGETWVLDSILFLMGGNGDLRSNYFGNINPELTNGLQVKIRSNGVEYAISTLKNNKDLTFSFHRDRIIGSTSMNLFKDVGGRVFMGEMPIDNLTVLKYSSSDYVRFTVNDDLTSIAFLESSVYVRRVV